jgi:membrane-bound lytic murein transglycosylase D
LVSTKSKRKSGSKDAGESKGKSKRSSDLQKSRRKTHTVRKGETLSTIAENYGTTVAALKRENPKMARNLKPGQVLVISK